MLEHIPESWRIVEMGDIASLIGGGTPSRKNRAFFQGIHPWVTGSDFAEDEITRIENAREYITDNAIEASATQLVPEQSVLITTRVNVGKVAIAQVPLCFSQDITAIVLQNTQITDCQYLAYFLFANREQLLRFNRGTTISGIRRSDLARLKIPLPTLPEQHEIVKILRLADHLRQLRTETDKKSEALLFSIFNQMFQQPKSSWIRCKLGDVISLETGKNIAAKPHPAEKGKWGILKVSAVTYGKFLPEENKEMPDNAELSLAYQVQKDDLLITRANTSELVGASAIVRNISQNLLLPDKIWRAVFDGKYRSTPYFMYGLLNTLHIRKEISRRATGTSGSMKNISQSNFLDTEILLPSDKEQQQFSDLAQIIWQNIHDYQASVGAQIASLTKAVQVNAFTGHLTKAYREINTVKLARLAQERNSILSQATEITESETIPSASVRQELRSKLSPFQQAIITSIEDADEYSTMDSVLSVGQLPSSQVQRNLDLLAKVGLIKVVKVAVAPGELGRVFFTKVYRALKPDDDVRGTDLTILHEAQSE